MSMVHALTFDVEDAVNQAMRNFFSTDMGPTFRVYDNTMIILDLLDQHETKSTFFILGEVAKSYPELIKKIANQGHELGIHGFSHARYNTLSRENVRNEIDSAKKLVEDISGTEVIGHRAPEFSISREMIWVMEIMFDLGIKYDSSIFPVRTGRYGWPGFKKDIDWLTINDQKKIIEAPLSVIKFFGKDIPVCGGGYLRIFPYFFSDYAFRIIQEKRPVNVYIHPYEIDPPPFQKFYMDKVRTSSLRNKLQLNSYWYNRKTVMPKLNRLLNTYKFTTLREVISTSLKTDI